MLIQLINPKKQEKQGLITNGRWNRLKSRYGRTAAAAATTWTETYSDVHCCAWIQRMMNAG